MESGALEWVRSWVVARGLVASFVRIPQRFRRSALALPRLRLYAPHGLGWPTLRPPHTLVGV